MTNVWVLIQGYRVFEDREAAIRQMEKDGWSIVHRRTLTFVMCFEREGREVAVQCLKVEK